MNQIIFKSLEKISNSLQNFKCQRYLQCCRSVIWLEPEEVLIRDYPERKRTKHILCTKEEFEKKHTGCKYLIDERFIIFPVNSIVSRSQGNISELKCKLSNDYRLLSQKELNNIIKKFIILIRKTNIMNVFL